MNSSPLVLQEFPDAGNMAAGNGHVYEFGDFRLIPGEGLLLHNGEPVPLTLKAFATLALLVDRHGHLVSKSELLETVWEDSFVEEGAVSRSIHAIRHALGENSKSNQFIQTVPRRGYRFVAPVQIVAGHSGAFRLSDMHGVDDAPTEGLTAAARSVTNDSGGEVTTGGRAAERLDVAVAEADVRPQQVTQGRRLLRSWAVYAGIAAVLVGGLVLYLTLSGGSILRSSPQAVKRSIAVLPLKSIDPANRHVLYEDGIVDSLINQIAGFEGFTVRPLNAIRGYAGVDIDPAAAGREQKTDYVLTSNYQLSDGKIKVTAQLIDVATGRIEDTFKTEKDASSVFAVQDAVAADFGEKLMARFAVKTTRPAAKRGTENEAAYRLYLRGHHLYHGIEDLGEGPTPVDMLEQAVALDPNFARAWTLLANAYVYRSTSPIAGGSDRQNAVDAVNKAVAIDPNLAEAHSAKCFVATTIEFDLAAAESACKRALEIDQRSAEAHCHYGIVLSGLRHHEKAVAEQQTATDLEPASAVYALQLGNTLYYARRFDEAAEQYKLLVDFDPLYYPHIDFLIRALEAQGKEAEAFECVIRSLTIRLKDPMAIERFRTIYQNQGWRGVLLERIRTMENPDQFDSFNVGGMYATLGDKDKAFEALEKAYERRAWPLTFIEDQPQLDPLRDDPRYHDLLRRIKGK